MLYLIIPGRINFKQMSRYSKHSEQRFRNQFKKKFDFITYDTSLIKPYLGKRTVISFDPSHITKSGKKDTLSWFVLVRFRPMYQKRSWNSRIFSAGHWFKSELPFGSSTNTTGRNAKDSFHDIARMVCIFNH